MEQSSCIIENLYLGGILGALNEKDLSGKEITHILSVDENPLPDAIAKKVTAYKHIRALDVSDCDLLSFFPEAFVFIEQARKNGGHILVHCQAGISRSATVVCAYLMQKMATTKDKALKLMISGRPAVRPNDGFMEQLELFESMGCQLVKTHPLYRSFQLRKLADRIQSGHYETGSPEMEVLSDLLLDSDFSAHGSDAFYKCRKCRVKLFRHGAVTSHKMGKGESAFDWRASGPAKHVSPDGTSTEEQGPCQRSLFVDPLSWMKGKINTTSGKLHCPKCEIKIGSFVWYGEKCPCGTWVAPAFHVDTGKVDKIPFQTVAPSARMPRGAANTATSSRESTATPEQSTTPVPERSSRPGHPSNRSLTTAKPSSTANVATVAPLVSSTAIAGISGDGSGRLIMGAARMEVEGSDVLSSSRTASVTSQLVSQQPGAVQMDVDS